VLGDMNWGRTAAYWMMALGLESETIRPRRATAWGRGTGPTDARRSPFERICFTPSQARYTMPIHFSARNAGAERAKTVPAPIAATVTCTADAAAMPTGAKIAARFDMAKPVATQKAALGPGLMPSTNHVAANVATESTPMTQNVSGEVSPSAELCLTYSEQMERSRISAIGSALADGTRSTILAALMSGTAHTAGELAKVSGVAASTASQHLQRLVDVGLVSMEPSGRHRYFRVASAEVAQLIEMIDSIELPETRPPRRPQPGTELSYARSCYDHLAGQLGVSIYSHLIRRGLIAADRDQPVLTPLGDKRFRAIGLDLVDIQHVRRPFIRPCLDWTQRQHHLGGALGSALLTYMLSQRWLVRRSNKRALRLTEAGRRGIEQQLEIVLSRNEGMVWR